MKQKDFANLRIWKRLEIGSHKVPVFTGDTLAAHQCYGLANLVPEYFIIIERSLSVTQRKRTLVHEVMEVVNDIYNLQINETGIRCMEQGVCQALKLHGGETKNSKEESG